jgi:hypothetical protein
VCWNKVDSNSIVYGRGREGTLDIHLFRDDADQENFAFSVDVTGANIRPITPHTEWIFIEAMDTLRFPEPWDIDDFQPVLNHLRAHGYYLFKGELVNPLGRFLVSHQIASRQALALKLRSNRRGNTDDWQALCSHQLSQTPLCTPGADF